MSVTLACMAGGPLSQALEAAQPNVRQLEPAHTPFGESEAVFLVEAEPAAFYLVPRRPPGRPRLTPSAFNCRATLYALKDLGVQAVLSWSAAGAITHNLAIGQIVIPDDVIDLTWQRANTFFPRFGLGLLRQFPVFCPALRGALAEVLGERKLSCHASGTAAVTEGPRLETPAEIRMLASFGAALVTHNLVPEVFLAKELQLCLAGGCYLVNYAETGSRHRPFITGDLFGGLTEASRDDRLDRARQALLDILRRLAAKLASAEPACQCRRTMAAQAEKYNLPDDWHQWFDLFGERR